MRAVGHQVHCIFRVHGTTGTSRFESILAGAGETHARRPAARRAGVDPRGCGGDLSVPNAAVPAMGRSPRVRGRHAVGPHHAEWRGSIPAGAGETSRSLSTRATSRVDPRGCGGDDREYVVWSTDEGRSPRVRGRHTAWPRPASGQGSIPAGAGETSTRARPHARTRVDPRGCGGDQSPAHGMPMHLGRSPRVRGRLARAALGQARQGSIPAGAGETPRRSAAPCAAGVDPRGCGGDLKMLSDLSDAEGRSPRVRGRPCAAPAHLLARGSIPAGAGETGRALLR